MNHFYRINDVELLSANHYPVKAMFDMVADSRFKRVVQLLSNNIGFGEEYGDCCFWGDLDEYDQANTEFFDGVEFGIEDEERVVISYEELLYYLKIACAGYCEDHPEDTPIILQYIEDYKTRNGLK